MAIFRKKNKTLQPIDWPPLADESSGSPAISNTPSTTILQGGISYTNPQVVKTFQLRASENNYVKQEPRVDESAWLIDIAQSHHYTVQLLRNNINDMSMSHLKTPRKSFSEFLPVKTMNLKYTSYENMSIPLAIFGDFPLLNKKRVSTIDLSCFDTDNNKLEYELRVWESQCFPKGRFVAYMDDIAREFVYRGYNVKGQETLTYRVYVIPAGNVTVSRDYSANEAKMVNFSLVVVGDGQTCASGNGKQYGVIVEDHGGMGDGRLPKGDFATLYVSGYGQFNKKTQRFEV